MTLPVLRALAVSPAREELLAIVTDPAMTDEMVARALAIVRATDGAAFAQAKAEAYLSRAKAVLPEELPEDIRDAYEQVADFIGQRNF